ncbi:hypothetical protein [Clostridium beijerinckii]|uniref:Uncharacterized protein n=1 Tax=Clostridium beijerinckii TaxID=1520 RepID=A0A9Q5GJG3_CLOBE|nr:hypothetical protein [Clostridium beijerinckii]AQS04796.1 hypothetical protein CLBIJ_22260 [Clostridium beijerinckii]MBA2887527.1 hypothetical protein [Clostridium beijerinckii]MBA2902417.1 hypothetical protein [Clostridium beijerinckii]MBA2912293.1 hypothetical protein [Clostridium beijerinckii]MBA9015645.1 hypothetical protein [Clostridium beijerinckii]
MKITNRELQSKVQVLGMLSNKQLPVKVSYAIAKNINSINKELKIFETEKMKIIKEYAIKDEHGEPKIKDNKFVFIEGKEEECDKKYNELLDIEVDLDVRGINIDKLLNSNVNFTPGELMELDFMILE